MVFFSSSFHFFHFIHHVTLFLTYFLFSYFLDCFGWLLSYNFSLFYYHGLFIYFFSLSLSLSLSVSRSLHSFTFTPSLHPATPTPNSLPPLIPSINTSSPCHHSTLNLTHSLPLLQSLLSPLLSPPIPQPMSSILPFVSQSLHS